MEHLFVIIATMVNMYISDGPAAAMTYLQSQGYSASDVEQYLYFTPAKYNGSGGTGAPNQLHIDNSKQETKDLIQDYIDSLGG